MRTETKPSFNPFTFLWDESGDAFYEFVLVASLGVVVCIIVYLALGKSI
ncbi:hypothetical protein MJ904_25005 [Massilia sp. MB5]|nr:hypothetical protein [Massilia sp. MB5]UMR30212.1 hypothetical protein MJ904_25005 [Massilia sp. MB5]